jgi:hypothetical protein
MIDSGELIPFNDLGAASVYLQERSATTPAEATSHLTAIKGEPRSGRRSPPNRLAATPGLVGRGLLLANHSRGSGPGDLLHLAPGEAKTVGDPPYYPRRWWAAPRSNQPSSWGLESGGFIQQEQWQ